MRLGWSGRRRTGVLAVLAVLARPAEAQDRTPMAAVSNPLAALPGDTLTAFRTRPLFAPGRTAAVAPEAQGVRAPPGPPDLKLVGIIGGRTRVAMVRIGEDAKARLLATGDMVEDWTVTVFQKSMRLTSGDRAVEIPLFVSAPPGSAPLRPPDEPPADMPDGPGP